RERPEDRAHHQPGYAFRFLGRVFAAARVLECPPPRVLGGAERAHHAALDAADHVPRLREAVVVAELLAGRERLLRRSAQVVAAAAQDLQRAEPDERAGRAPAAQLERVL